MNVTKEQMLTQRVHGLPAPLPSCRQNYRVSKRGLDDRFGYGDYNAIQKAPLEEIVEALRAGGLSNVKGKVRR